MFSAPIRPLSLMTTSPFAALVIFSIHRLLSLPLCRPAHILYWQSQTQCQSIEYKWFTE
jgi:hypothetical protein